MNNFLLFMLTLQDWAQERGRTAYCIAGDGFGPLMFIIRVEHNVRGQLYRWKKFHDPSIFEGVNGKVLAKLAIRDYENNYSKNFELKAEN